MFRWFCVSLMLLLTAGVSYATCVVPARRVFHAPAVFAPTVHPTVVHTPVVHTPTVYSPVVPVYTPVAVFAAFPVAVPTYTAAYTPTPFLPQAGPGVSAGAGVGPGGVASGTAEILLELRKLNGRIDALERRGPSPAPPAPLPEKGQVPPPPKGKEAPVGQQALSLFTTKCAACHSPAKAATEGGEFVLVNGAVLNKLTERQLLRMSNHLYKGTMPPRNNKYKALPLTDEEVGVGMAWIDTQRP